MPTFCNPGTILDRLLMAILTLLAVGCAVLGVRELAEPFAWSLLAGLLPLAFHPGHRARGLAVWAATVLLPFTAFDGPAVVRGIFTGLMIGSLLRSGCYHAAFIPEPAGQPNRLPLAVGQQLILVGLSMLCWVEVGTDWLPWVALAACGGLWLCCVRQAFELIFQGILRLMYRVRWAGPGTRRIPPRGPVLVIANHACWFDPMFLGKLLPRPMKPMMTSRFFNIWYLKPLLKYLFRVIVVPDVERRRDAPELRDAAAALRQAECIIIFPEGYLRRTEDKPLRRFGQGAWQILKDCPDVPVVACWIEGGWGSWGSHKDGPPGSKPRDWGRPIHVGVAAPMVIPSEVLADQMRTRFHLMNMVSNARAHVGLDPLPPFEMPASGAAPKDEA